MRSQHRPGNFLNIGERGVAGRRSCRHDAQSAPTSRGLAPEREGGVTALRSSADYQRTRGVQSMISCFLHWFG